MDKRSAGILIGCFMCTTIVALLFLAAYQLSQRPCELIFVDPAQHRLSALESWRNTSARRSHDKTLLLRISALLEYNLQSGAQSESQGHNQTNGGGLVGPHHPLPQAQFLLLPTPAPSGFNVTQTQPLTVQSMSPGGSSNRQQQQPLPSVGQTNATNTAPNQQLAASPQALNSTVRERFLPLHLERVEMERKHNETTYEYRLLMNCTTITVIFVRLGDKIRLNQARLELKPTVQKKSKCELEIPATAGFFEAEIDAKHNLAHYDNKQFIEPLRCVDKRSGDLLAKLDIHALEFETSLGSKKDVGKKFKNHQQSS